MTEEKVTIKSLAAEMARQQVASDAKFDAILQKLSGPGITAKPLVESVEKEEGGPNSERVQIPPSYRKHIDEILGTDFECEFELSASGSQKFTIVVPKEKSNMSKSYKDMFKTDRRTKELKGTGADGVKIWCLKIRGNLIRSDITLTQYP